MDKLNQKGSKIAELIEKGREQGYLTYSDVNDHLPDDISDPDPVSYTHLTLPTSVTV